MTITREEYVKKERMVFIANMLKNVGFECTNNRALMLLDHSFLLFFSSVLKTLKIRTIHSNRAKVTIIDILKMKQNKEYYDKIKEFVILLSRLHNEENIVNENVEIEENEKEETKFTISTQIEKYVHIYDHLPPFPPSHTFRKTIIKEQKVSSCDNLKKRMEESLRAEKNLFRMMEVNNFVNFLYQKNEEL